MAGKIFQNLQGAWRLSRQISGSHLAYVTGTAVFETTTHLHELRYSEDVEITLDDGKKLKGHQHYIYRLEDDNKINVYFDGGDRLFHSICISSEHGSEHQASHYCQPDTYTTSYFFEKRGFQIEHRVKGPKKDYISRTTYAQNMSSRG